MLVSVSVGCLVTSLCAQALAALRLPAFKPKYQPVDSSVCLNGTFQSTGVNTQLFCYDLLGCKNISKDKVPKK